MFICTVDFRVRTKTVYEGGSGNLAHPLRIQRVPSTSTGVTTQTASKSVTNVLGDIFALDRAVFVFKNIDFYF